MVCPLCSHNKRRLINDCLTQYRNKMKTTQKYKWLTIVITASAMIISCNASKQVTITPKPQNPFDGIFETPCSIEETPDMFTAIGIFRGSSRQMGEVQKNALLAAQELIRLKMQHAYKGVVREYSQTPGTNQGNDIERKVTIAGDRVIDKIINETFQSCLRWSAIEDDGHITCYTAIQISKKDVAVEIAKNLANELSQQEKDSIGFNEQEYHNKIEKDLKEYKENH